MALLFDQVVRGGLLAPDVLPLARARARTVDGRTCCSLRSRRTCPGHLGHRCLHQRPAGEELETKKVPRIYGLGYLLLCMVCKA